MIRATARAHPGAPSAAPSAARPCAARRALLLGAGAAALSACTPLGAIQQAAVPPALYRLSPKSTFREGLPKLAAQLVIDEPTAGAAVDTDRIAVRPHPLMIEYYPAARWVDRAPLMVQTLLVESFENADEDLSVGRRATGLAADYTLLTELREFQVEAPENGALEAYVRLNFKLVAEPGGLIFAATTIERRAPAAASGPLAGVEAMDAAFGKVIRRAVEWSLDQAAAHWKTRPRW
ncbi:ABC-type transport auxiliary lipoprotein family protein [Rhodovulum sp. DZ06]|uniref:ABC-type transport auxiliary lipoprotein family protein n=1 Tax=Rhodovulum sp. DZ06 TaxID=3425126 RepID=UPI003D34435D